MMCVCLCVCVCVFRCAATWLRCNDQRAKLCKVGVRVSGEAACVSVIRVCACAAMKKLNFGAKNKNLVRKIRRVISRV